MNGTITATEERFLGSLLARNYPDLAKQLLSESLPVIDDLELVALVVSDFEIIYQGPLGSTRDVTQFRLVLIAICLYLFDPGLIQDLRDGKMRPGLRQALATQLGCSETRISNLATQAKDHLGIYKSFKKEVEFYFSQIILNQIYIPDPGNN